jgi:hypothetical protein
VPRAPGQRLPTPGRARGAQAPWCSRGC